MPPQPGILITTSRRPSRRIRKFCKDFSHIFPNVIPANRGKLNLDGVAEKALKMNAQRVMLVGRWKGRPGKIQLFTIGKKGLNLTPPLIYVKGVKLMRDFKGGIPKKGRINSIGITSSRRSPSEVKKFADVLSDFFGFPLIPLKQSYDGDFDATLHLSPNASNGMVISVKLLPELIGVPPQIRISHLIWKLD